MIQPDEASFVFYRQTTDRARVSDYPLKSKSQREFHAAAIERAVRPRKQRRSQHAVIAGEVRMVEQILNVRFEDQTIDAALAGLLCAATGRTTAEWPAELEGLREIQIDDCLTRRTPEVARDQ